MTNKADSFDIKRLQLGAKATLADAIKAIDSGNVQIVFVVDQHESLLGTITDGDIRRALLRGVTLEANVEQIMFRNFRSLPIHATEDDALALMRSESLHQIPVVDQQKRLCKLYLLEELIKPKRYGNPVVIMAGGEGKRLRPLTQDCPKPMLKVAGKPLLEIILNQCIAAGFENFYVSVNYLKEQIKDYFQDGARWGVNIQYLEEDKPLGTAGALSLLPMKPAEPVLVLNGDLLTRVDYSRLLRFHEENSADLTMCVREHTTQIPYGVVKMSDSRVMSIEEKPVLSHYVNAGIYLIGPRAFNCVPQDQFFDMPHLIEQSMLQNHCVSAFPIHEYWLDIGLPETLAQAHGEWK